MPFQQSSKLLFTEVGIGCAVSIEVSEETYLIALIILDARWYGSLTVMSFTTSSVESSGGRGPDL